MQSEQRPWIAADIFIDNAFQYDSFIGDTLAFHFRLLNVGKSPAFNVTTFAVLYTPQALNEDLFATWRDKCTAQGLYNSDDGLVLFPTQEKSSDEDAPGQGHFLSNDNINTGRKVENGDVLRIYIMGCVRYSDSTGVSKHQTGILYALRTRDKATGAWNVGIDPRNAIPAAEIVPVTSHFSSGMTY
jgi:hypothetical protein